MSRTDRLAALALAAACAARAPRPATAPAPAPATAPATAPAAPARRSVGPLGEGARRVAAALTARRLVLAAETGSPSASRAAVALWVVDLATGATEARTLDDAQDPVMARHGDTVWLAWREASGRVAHVVRPLAAPPGAVPAAEADLAVSGHGRLDGLAAHPSGALALWWSAPASEEGTPYGVVEVVGSGARHPPLTHRWRDAPYLGVVPAGDGWTLLGRLFGRFGRVEPRWTVTLTDAALHPLRETPAAPGAFPQCLGSPRHLVCSGCASPVLAGADAYVGCEDGVVTRVTERGALERAGEAAGPVVAAAADGATLFLATRDRAAPHDEFARVCVGAWGGAQRACVEGASTLDPYQPRPALAARGDDVAVAWIDGDQRVRAEVLPSPRIPSRSTPTGGAGGTPRSRGGVRQREMSTVRDEYAVQ